MIAMTPTQEALSDVRAYQQSKAQSPDIAAAIRLISAASELFQNGDTRAQDAALEAFQDGRPAYWSKGVYSNQRASRLLWVANRFSLDTALRQIADDHPSYAARAPYLLGTLIPLNLEAMHAIERAWSEYGER